MQQEVWRPVVGFEGYYEVSNQGRIRGLPRLNSRNSDYHQTRILSPGRGSRGYYTVGLKVDGREKRRYVHQLVLEAFVGAAPRGSETRHRDGVKAHNQLDNLCWGTRKENADDRIAHGTHPIGSRNGFAKLSEAVVPGIRAAHAAGATASAIARQFAVTRMTIVHIVKNRTWTHV